MIPISKPQISNEAIQAVVKVLKSGMIAQGPKTEELEQQFAQLCGTKHAVAVNNGTSALHVALHAIGIKPGDEVITTPFTFIATANAILMCGAIPVFVDIDPETYNLDPTKIEQAITKKTKAIVVVNIYGQPADYTKINTIARKHHLKVVEDAAQSIDANYNGKKSGAVADIAAFSFYATKNITCGEGGMVTMNNETYYVRAILFRNHGMPPEKKYTYLGMGYNYRLSDIMSVMISEQLNQLTTLTKKRQEIAKEYNEAFKTLNGVQLPLTKPNRSHVYHQYTLRITKKARQSRDELKEYLYNNGVQTNVYYPYPLYTIEHLKQFKKSADIFPVTEEVVTQVLSIPIYPELSPNDLDHIKKTVINALT